MKPSDLFGRDVGARLADVRAIALESRKGFFFKHALIAIGLMMAYRLSASWSVGLLFAAYLALDWVFVFRFDEIGRRFRDKRANLRGILLLRWVVVILFISNAVLLAMSGNVVLQLGGLMLLAGHALHALAARTASADMLLPDALGVILGCELIAVFALNWAGPAERLVLHGTLGLLGLFFLAALVQAHRLHIRLKTTSARLANAQRAGVIGQLAGGIAHDFNNLLTVMRGNLDLLREVPEEERPALLAQIEEAAARGGELVARLSGAGRREPGQIAVAASDAVGRRAVAMARRTLPANIRVTEGFDQALLNARADPAELELALLNLLTNAADAMPGGGRVHLSSRALDDGRIAITVEDEGIGMAPDLIARATDPYETTKPHGRGTGLGLAMVKAFVEDADGALTIDSAPGRGTRMTMTLRTAPTLAGHGDAA